MGLLIVWRVVVSFSGEKGFGGGLWEMGEVR